MKERPILFSGPMVKAILAGEKTQTRRVVKPQPEMEMDGEILPDGSGGYCWVPVLPPWSKWPFFTGDVLWVRESWRPFAENDTGCCGVEFRAGGAPRETQEAARLCDGTDRWRPSIHMPRWASRILLEITNVPLECDHIFPLSRGGSSDRSNLITACKKCNRQKHDKTLSEWLQ